MIRTMPLRSFWGKPEICLPKLDLFSPTANHYLAAHGQAALMTGRCRAMQGEFFLPMLGVFDCVGPGLLPLLPLFATLDHFGPLSAILVTFGFFLASFGHFWPAIDFKSFFVCF